MGVLDTPAASLTPRGQQQLLTQRALMLPPWYKALARRDVSRANVVILGDSWTAGQGASAYLNAYGRKLATLLRKRLGLPAGGTGFLHQNRGLGSGVTSFTWPVTLTGTASNTTTFGPTRSAITLNAVNDSATFTVTGTSVDLMWALTPAAGTFGYTVDGGSETTASANGTQQDGRLTRISLGASGSHTVVVRLVSGTVVRIDGVIVYDGDETAGIGVHSCGYVGSTATDPWQNTVGDSTSWLGALNALAPNVLCIELGLNDQTAAVGGPTFQANLQQLVTNIRTVVSVNVPIVLIACPVKQGASGTWPAYLAAMYAVAAANTRCMVFDLTQRINPYDTDTESLWNNTIHVNDDGHAMIADALASFLLPV